MRISPVDTKSRVDLSSAQMTPQYDEINLDRLWELIHEEAELFIQRTPKSSVLHEQATKSMINGLPMSWQQIWRHTNYETGSFLLPHNWYWDRAKNQKVWDVDGNEYIDYFFAETPTIWGHCPDDAYTQGIIDCIKKTGLGSMVPHEDSIVAAELLQKLIGLKYWYVTLSASDADRNAISIARTITGRSKVLTPHLGYMGLNEEGMYWQPKEGDEISPRWPHLGVADVKPQVKFTHFNDLESLDEALKDRDVAIYIVEPMMTDSGLLPAKPGYLEGAAELCKKYGTLFLIDETHTLTHAPGGMYSELELEADMWVTGKAIGGGVACGLLGLSEEIGEKYRSRLNDLSVGWGIGSLTGQGTTMSGNLLSVRALRLALEHYYTDETYSKMTGAMNHLVAGLRGVIDKHQAPFSVLQSGARCHINVMPEDPENIYESMLCTGWGGYHEYLTLFTLNRGIVPNPFFNILLTSPHHTESDNNKYIEIFDECVANMLQ